LGLFDWFAQDFLAYKEVVPQFLDFGNAPFLIPLHVTIVSCKGGTAKENTH